MEKKTFDVDGTVRLVCVMWDGRMFEKYVAPLYVQDELMALANQWAADSVYSAHAEWGNVNARLWGG